jgi:Xaa-Pro aminopeptidase
LIRRIDPRRIGIDISPGWAFGDGLSASLRDRLEAALGPELGSRLVSAEKLCLGWIERRSPAELSVYRHICGVAHDLIAEFFSSRVIIPDVTTTDSVRWWIRQRIAELGLEAWFHPALDVIRSPSDSNRYPDRSVIRRGDLLHCDVGLRYLGLCTDMQWHAYVLREGETVAPAGLTDALRRAVEVARIFRAEFHEGRTGAEITAAAMAKASEAGLRPLLYSHPLGLYGHSAGCVMEARPPEQAPEGTALWMEYPLFADTVYAVEFSSTSAVPEWGGRDVVISYEETAAFTGLGCRFLDGQQTELILIR